MEQEGHLDGSAVGSHIAGRRTMTPDPRRWVASLCILWVLCTAGLAHAQKHGGILRMYSPDSPASMSIHEEATVFAEGPMMGVFNNLVMYDQHVPKNSLQSNCRSEKVSSGMTVELSQPRMSSAPGKC